MNRDDIELLLTGVRLGRISLKSAAEVLHRERDSLKRVVSAPEARAATSAAEADLGPVSAPGARLRDIEYDIFRGWKGMKQAEIAFNAEPCVAALHRVEHHKACWITACWRLSQEIERRAEADRAPVGAQVEPSRRANDSAQTAGDKNDEHK